MQGLVIRLVLAAGLCAASAVQAQQQPETVSPPSLPRSVQSPILTIDSDRVFLESEFGRRVAEEIEERGNALSAENRRIEADLEAEEQELTLKRAQMSPEAFRSLADDFDEKVQAIRRAQAAKSRALNAQLDEEREAFLAAAGPVLEQLMRNAGAGVILERRSVFVSASAIEITDAAIALLNETIGSGEGAGD